MMGKDMKFTITRYMDDFPFEYYLIVKEVKSMSAILADVLRQYFEQK
jgi:midasin (ATPase involved in ribosome maturation)